jgi:hypothetical protein
MKTCPECGATFGARKLKCDCGYDFGCKRTGKAAVQVDASVEPAEPVKPAEPAEPAEPAPSSGKRGKKVCPKCHTEHGARKLVCECGYDFGCKRTGKAAVKSGQVAHPLYPEPGAWVVDQMKGMPTVHPPDPLPKGPVSAEVVKEHVSYEGLGFTLYSYIPAKRISDPKLQALWREARAAMQKVVEYLEDISFPE